MLNRLLLFVLTFTIMIVIKSYAQSNSIDLNQLENITPQNLADVQKIGQIGNGGTGVPVWSGDGNVLGVMNSAGFWLHDASNLSSNPTLIVETSFPSQALLNNDGSRLLIWNENSIEYWDTTTKTCFQPCPFPSYEFSRIQNVLLSPDGTRLVIATGWGASWDYDRRRVVLYDLLNQTILFQTEFSMGYGQLEFSRDGLTLIIGDRSLSQLVSVETGEIQAEYYVGRDVSNYLLVNPENISQGFLPDKWTMIDIASGDELQKFDASADLQYVSFSFHPENYLSAYYTTENERHLLIWNVEAAELLGDFVIPSSADAAYSIQGDWLLAKGDGILNVHAIKTGEDAFTIEFADEASLVANTMRLAVTQDSKLSLWDLSTQTEIASSSDFYFSSGELVAVRENIVVSQKQSILFIWDAVSSELLASWTLEMSFSKWQFSSDGVYLVGSSYSDIVFLNIETGETRIIETLERDSINDFVLTSDGRYLITATGQYQYCPDPNEVCTLPDSSVRIWDANTGEEISLLEIDESGNGIYSSVALSQDEHWLAVGSLNVVNIYDFSGFPTLTLPIASTIHPMDAIIDLAFKPDGSEIAVGYGILYSNDGFAGVGTDASVWQMDAVLNHPDASESGFLLGFWGNAGVSEIHYDNLGAFLLTRGRDASVIWPIGENEELDFGFGYIANMRFTLDNRLLLVSTGNGTIEFWAVPMIRE